ncbi:MAG: AAA domain-containing protein [Methanospirillum sp.]
MVTHHLNPTLVARYFFFECPRYLRLQAMPLGARQVDRLPSGSLRPSLAARFLTEEGERWETEVVTSMIPGEVHMAAPGMPNPGRHRLTPLRTQQLLGTARPGEYLFQATFVPPRDLLAPYGLDPALCRFNECVPDLLAVRDGGLVRVVDVKASELLRGSHRVQVALYALVLDRVLRELGLPLRADVETGGVWLQGQKRPEWFDLAPGAQVLRDFFTADLPSMLDADPLAVGWHLHSRCEWCPFYHYCRDEAEAISSVSLLPYLSVHARRYLHKAPWKGGTAIETLDDLGRLLEREDAAAIFSLAGSLRNQEAAYGRALAALRTGAAVPHDAVSIAFPRAEDLRLVLTLQEDPVTGMIYAAGLNRFGGGRVFGSPSATRVFVAGRREDCPTVVAAFLRELYDLLSAVHGHNGGREWAEQVSLQAYVYDRYELDLLSRLLHEAVGDPELAQMALALLFHFQDPGLAEADRHPAGEVLFPVIVLTRVLQRMVALPVPFAYGLPEVGAALGCRFVCPRDPAFWFDLSNVLRSDLVLGAWEEGRPELAERTGRELERRLRAASSVVDGVREALSGRGLFAYPPRFRFPEPFDLAAPELSRLAFIVRYESYMHALELRERRAEPFEGRVADGVSVPLVYRGGMTWEPEVPVDRFRVVREHGLDHRAPVSLLVPAGEEGERAQQRHDDVRLRSFRARPPDGSWYVRLRPDDDRGDRIARFEVRFSRRPDPFPFAVGDRAVVHPVAKDYTSDQVLARLAAIDAADDPPLLRLIRDPVGFAEPVDEPAETVADALARGRAARMTASQQAALRHLLDRRLTLVWGPPGTGKTAFLAKGLLALGRARAAAGLSTRVMVSALTNAAIENVLSAIADEREEQGIADDILIAKLGRWQGRAGRPAGIQALEPRDVTPDRLDRRAIAVIGGTGYKLDRIAGGDGGPCFDLLVVDEASQLRFPELALGLDRLSPGSRLVLVGDDLQLPPITKGEYPPPEDGRPGLEASAFAYLRARDAPGEAAFTRTLTENWRMNATLSRFPAETIYPASYAPATPAVASRTLALRAPSEDGAGDGNMGLLAFLLAPGRPLGVAILEDVRATVENRPEAELVAGLAVLLRDRLLDPATRRPYAPTEEGDRAFWREGLEIVCPHHAQIHAVRQLLGQMHERDWVPFVDTVDKMQGQQSEAVLVSYGVSDVETALSEAAFIYSLNRLNVAVTRGRAKCVVCLPRPLLKASPAVLEDEEALRGLSHMLALVEFAKAHGEERTFRWTDANGATARVTAIRARVEPESAAGVEVDRG